MGFAVVVADEHEAAAAEVSSCGVDDGEGKADGDGCVDGVAALLQDGKAGVGGVVVDGDDHGVFGADRLVGLLREGGVGSEEGGNQSSGDGKCGEER